MSSAYVDLHCHSTASDGKLEPRAVMRLAKEKGISAVSLTDHDTVGGIADAADECRKLGIDFIPGIELSCEFPRPGTMHLLGYGVDPSKPELAGLTDRLLSGRNSRNDRIIEKLNSLGYAITMEEVKQLAGGTVGRPHIAEVLVRKGHAKNWQDAFDRFIGQGGIAYLDKETLTARQAIDLVHQSGGVVCLAHPVQVEAENFAHLETIIKNLIDAGLDGIEVMHSDHDAEWIMRLDALATQYHLLRSGGSDFHGRTEPHVQLGFAGGKRVPREYFDAIVARLGRN